MRVRLGHGSYYDLVIGLHPDEAVREVVESAKVRPVLVVPCCNFWDRTRKLGTKEMVADICKWLEENGIRYETVTFSFKGPKKYWDTHLPLGRFVL